MIEDQLGALPLQELVELLNRVLSSKDEVSDHRRSGLRIAQFVHYVGEPAFHELVGAADWRGVEPEDHAMFPGHFSKKLVQSGTCDVCRSEIVSYSKSARCPACDASVECT